MKEKCCSVDGGTAGSNLSAKIAIIKTQFSSNLAFFFFLIEVETAN